MLYSIKLNTNFNGNNERYTFSLFSDSENLDVIKKELYDKALNYFKIKYKIFENSYLDYDKIIQYFSEKLDLEINNIKTSDCNFYVNVINYI